MLRIGMALNREPSDLPGPVPRCSFSATKDAGVERNRPDTTRD
uniref:Uncharacterized protein n=1 Tax=Rhizophora mucronata TaxID=61149 RepID=A0A2P2QNM5_RHIMU